MLTQRQIIFFLIVEWKYVIEEKDGPNFAFAKFFY